jgi:hypothetical protein
VRLFYDPDGLKKDVPPMKWQQLLNPPRGVGRLSLLAGYAAGEACSLYAIFVAHTMNPVSYRMVENDLALRAIYGRYQEVYDLDGLVFTLIASFVVFAMAWFAVRGIAWTIKDGSLTPELAIAAARGRSQARAPLRPGGATDPCRS